MQPEYLCHLPGVRLETGTDQQLANGAVLMPLPFEEWLALEDPVVAEQERKYRGIAPVFARLTLPEGGSPGKLTALQEHAIENIIEQVHIAAALSFPEGPSYSPSSSVAYVVWRGVPYQTPDENGWFGPLIYESAKTNANSGFQLGSVIAWIEQPSESGSREQWVVERRFGLSQRESLLSNYALDTKVWSAREVHRFTGHYSRLVRAKWGPRRAAAVRCADVFSLLKTGALPLSEIIVALVAAFENIVNATGLSPLGETFALRCSAWLASNPVLRADYQMGFHRLYGLRSDLVHGTDPQISFQHLLESLHLADAAALYEWLELQAQLAVLWLISWYGKNPNDDGTAALFRKELTKVSEASVEAWLDLRSSLVQEEESHATG